jgi:hypothetical protein
MGSGESSGSENANLYMRGVDEGRTGEILDPQELLNLLDVFGEDGLRIYLVGYVEGIEDLAEEEADEIAELEASIAYVVHESSVSIMEESEDTFQVWMEDTPIDLGPEIDLHIVDDEDEILRGGRIVKVEFEQATSIDSEEGEGGQESIPALVTVEEWKVEIIEYTDPED